MRDTLTPAEQKARLARMREEFEAEKKAKAIERQRLLAERR